MLLRCPECINNSFWSYNDICVHPEKIPPHNWRIYPGVMHITHLALGPDVIVSCFLDWTAMLEEIQGTNGWLCYGQVTEDFVRPLRSRKGHKVAFDTPNCDPLRERHVTGHYCSLEAWQWKISGCVPKNPRCRLFPRLHKSCELAPSIQGVY